MHLQQRDNGPEVDLGAAFKGLQVVGCVRGVARRPGLRVLLIMVCQFGWGLCSDLQVSAWSEEVLQQNFEVSTSAAGPAVYFPRPPLREGGLAVCLHEFGGHKRLLQGV